MTDDRFTALTSIDVIADGYLIATSKISQAPLALVGKDKFNVPLGLPPMGMSWVGWKPDANFPNIYFFPVMISKVPQFVE